MVDLSHIKIPKNLSRCQMCGKETKKLYKALCRGPKVEGIRQRIIKFICEECTSDEAFVYYFE